MAISSVKLHIETFRKFLEKEEILFSKKFSKNIGSNCDKDTFKFIQTIVRGRFSDVYLAQHQTTNELFALKIVEKLFLVKNNLILHAKNEIKISYAIKFEFLINLSYYFTDNTYLYLGYSFLSAGDLFAALNTNKKFNENLGKFYASQILLALEYLHYMGVIYRDMKPENILLLNDGYLKLIDYGFCKKINDTRTYTFCGTPEYIAPELILLKGYDYAIDWWSFGVLVYEMIAGVSPFFDEDQATVYENIINCDYIMPGNFSVELQNLIQNIIVINKTERYGCLHNGVNDIKEHAWFSDINWDDVLHKRTKPPSYPTKLSGPPDTSIIEKIPPIELKTISKDIFANHFIGF